MTQPASAAQITKIHALGRNAGLNEQARRDVIAGVANGKRSSKELTIVEARAVIDRLAALAGPRVPSKPPAAKGALMLDGPYVGKVRALWISGWHLGVVRDRSDTAMVAFVERQTRIANMRWLRDPADARKVIEALKGWLARAAGVEWGGEEADADGAKRAVYLAIRRLLTVNGVDPHFAEFPGRRFLAADPRDIDELTKAAAARLRRARAQAGGA